MPPSGSVLITSPPTNRPDGTNRKFWLGFVEKTADRLEVALGGTDARHGHAPPVGVLRQARRVAQCRGCVEVRDRRREVVLLQVELREADVHVGSAPKWRSGRCPEPQAALERPPRIGEVSLGDADVRHGEGATQHVGMVPGPLEVRDGP